MPNADHFAIVVGISLYPKFGETPETAPNLKGPENDADAVCDWLTSEQGGDVPPGNIKVIKSPDASVPDFAQKPQPNPVDIEAHFLSLDEMAQKNKKLGKGMRVGRRLYVYMSGHGFSPKRNQGCLFAANATMRVGYNVFASRWLEWYQDAQYFDEFVLWMDCCMNRMQTLPPNQLPVVDINSPDPAGPTFIAYAAQRPLKAVEQAIAEDKGRVHGVFTWALLEGLRGAAADGNGMVTGRSLADWLRNSMKVRISDGDLKDPDVAKEPEISKEDSGVIFGRGLAPKSYPVRLSFPATAVGKDARVWSGRPPKIAQTFKIEEAPKQLSLHPGLYLLDAPGAGLRHGFEVACAADIAIAETGVPVGAGGDIFLLEVVPADPTAEIFVVDERFALVDRDAGKLRSRLPLGIYKIKTRVGRTVREKIILLDQDRSSMEGLSVPIASAAPLPESRTRHEYHEAAVDAAAERVDEKVGKGAKLSIVTRTWTKEGVPTLGKKPWQGVKIVDERGKVIADLEKDGTRDISRDPVAACSLEIPPGTYFLRQSLEEGREIEQSLIVPAKWHFWVFLLRRADTADEKVSPRPRLSLTMHRATNKLSLTDPAQRVLEAARVALADERKILNDKLEEMLLTKFNDPIAGIIGCHLLLVEQERDPKRDISLLNSAVKRLRDMVGTEHPDVEAISLRCPDEKLRRAKPISAPPMFQRSWQFLTADGKKGRSLVPSGIWRRVQANAVLPPFFVWAPDPERKAANVRALAESILGAVEMPARPKSAAARKVARTDKAQVSARAARLQVPTSALAYLRKEFASKGKG